MQKTSNPYVQNLLQKGYTAAECRTPAPKQQFPLNLYGRVFETEAEYREALHDFLSEN